MKIDQPLSGSDYFHLLLDRKMLRNGLTGNISRIHFQLDASADLNQLNSKLSANTTLTQIHQLKVKLRWPFVPKWKAEKRETKKVEVHLQLSQKDFESYVLNRKVDNENGLVHIDLCELKSGTKHVIISMHHVLFDHQGMSNFLQALSNEKAAFPLFPKTEKNSFTKSIVNSVYTTIYMLKSASSKLAILVDKNLKLSSSPSYTEIKFTAEETQQIEKHAWQTGARIGRSSFYISAIAKVVLQTIENRGEKPPYVWFSVPHNQRKRGTAGHLVSNQLSFLFFKLTTDNLKDIASAVQSVNEQLKLQIQKRITDRYSDLQNALRFVPMPVYELMVDSASKGKISSFSYSDLGEDILCLNTFLGAKILDTFHYAPVPCPPGINITVIKQMGQLKFVIGYLEEAISDNEMSTLKNNFRTLLLSDSL